MLNKVLASLNVLFFCRLENLPVAVTENETKITMILPNSPTAWNSRPEIHTEPAYKRQHLGAWNSTSDTNRSTHMFRYLSNTDL